VLQEEVVVRMTPGAELPPPLAGFEQPAWAADAPCREHPEVEWFPERGESMAAAKAVCRRCPVRDECLSYAVADPTIVGVWGGTSGRERRRMRERRAAPERGPERLHVRGMSARHPEQRVTTEH
jgi:WhiB family transcriptional regulator, redox-sensing transcriptional regulator